MSKPRVIKDFENLAVEIQEQIKLAYPDGFEDNLIRFVNAEGKYVSALPFETDDKYYMVRMTVAKAKEIIEDDEDYDEDGMLRAEVKELYEDRYDSDDSDEDEDESSGRSHDEVGDDDDDDDDDDDY